MSARRCEACICIVCNSRHRLRSYRDPTSSFLPHCQSLLTRDRVSLARASLFALHNRTQSSHSVPTIHQASHKYLLTLILHLFGWSALPSLASTFGQALSPSSAAASSRQPKAQETTYRRPKQSRALLSCITTIKHLHVT